MTANKTSTISEDSADKADSTDIEKGFDHDSFWKELRNRFCYQLIKRAVPELYEKIDTTKAHRMLDKEFTDLLNTGKRALGCVINCPIENKIVK